LISKTTRDWHCVASAPDVRPSLKLAVKANF
jgi:hypothetical protein